MGYLHIANLYSDPKILLFRECYALEKLHGTSAHVSWDGEKVTYFSGGEKYANFILLFDDAKLTEAFKGSGPIGEKIVVFGEAYGGKQQGQSWRYWKSLKFCAFDVQIGDHWLDVPGAERFCQGLGIEFVHYKLIPATIEALDAERDAPSEQAKRNGVEGDHPREGVVCRPIIEMRTSAEKRVIVKHKRAEERETHRVRTVLSPEDQKVLDDAQEIANEFVTPVRLDHVLCKLMVDGQDVPVERMGDVIRAMVEDVLREGNGELVDSKEARKAIGNKAVSLFKKRMALFATGRGDLWEGVIKA